MFPRWDMLQCVGHIHLPLSATIHWKQLYRYEQVFPTDFEPLYESESMKISFQSYSKTLPKNFTYEALAGIWDEGKCEENEVKEFNFMETLS